MIWLFCTFISKPRWLVFPFYYFFLFVPMKSDCSRLSCWHGFCPFCNWMILASFQKPFDILPFIICILFHCSMYLSQYNCHEVFISGARLLLLPLYHSFSIIIIHFGIVVPLQFHKNFSIFLRKFTKFCLVLRLESCQNLYIHLEKTDILTITNPQVHCVVSIYLYFFIFFIYIG